MIGEFIATHKFLVGLIAGGFIGVWLGLLIFGLLQASSRGQR